MSNRPLLSSSTLQHMRAMSARVELRTAQDVQIGGDTWDVIETTGDGIRQEQTESVTHQVTLSVIQMIPEVERMDPSANFVGVARWKFVATPGTPVRENNRIRSVAMPSLVFQVMAINAPDEWGWMSGLLEPEP